MRGRPATGRLPPLLLLRPRSCGGGCRAPVLPSDSLSLTASQSIGQAGQKPAGVTFTGSSAKGKTTQHGSLNFNC